MNKSMKWISSCGLALMVLSSNAWVKAQVEEQVPLVEPESQVQSVEEEIVETRESSQEDILESTLEYNETQKKDIIREENIDTSTVNEEQITTIVQTTEENLTSAYEQESTVTTEVTLKTSLEGEKETSILETTQTSIQESSVTTQEEPVKVIVRTNNTAAIDRADYQDNQTYKYAVMESEKEVKATIDEISKLLAGQGIELKHDQEFSGVMTGFSAFADQAMIEQLKKMTQVLGVDLSVEYERPNAKPQMNSSGPLVGMDLLSEYQSKYKGENILVSVIDTGFDPYHRDFVLADDVEKRYEKAEMDQMIQELGLPGKWYSNKVVYGYNYADNVDTLQSSDEHGNHVAGTIGANGDPSQGGIKGIAPHVQLLLMKAFSEDQVDSSVYEDIWLKAFDDSIKLGADIINMSLGMPSGFNINNQTPMAIAIQKARDKGILPLIAGGNDRNATWGSDDTQLHSNPDNGVIGYPASVDGSMAVASFDNLKEMKRYVEAQFEDQKQFFPGSFTYPEGFSEALPLIDFGKGNLDDYEKYSDDHGQKIDLTGQLVIVERGDASFADKYRLAQEHGAAGVIIYDNVESPYTMEMTGIENLDIPVMFVTRDSGLKLIEIAKNQSDSLFKISKDLLAFTTPTAGNLSEFSSWGPTTDLLLKPDISAPGGFIYSLMSDDRYQNMSGTSMATPHMAGMAAVLIQRLYDEGILVKQGSDKDPFQDDLAMLFLMNTAVPQMNTLVDDASYFTPIQQGAGLANIHNALNDFVTVTATNGQDQKADGKLELKEVQDQFSADLQLRNYGKEDMTYEVSYILLKDGVNEEGRYTESSLVVAENSLGQVTVKAGQTADLSKVVSTDGINLNQYVQGYFFFKPINTEGTPLSLPFFGFKGKWDELPILDNMIDFTDESQVNFKPIVYPEGGIDKTGFVRKRLEQGWDYFNAWKINDENTVFVNSNELTDFENQVTPKLSFLRNAVDVSFRIEDANRERIRDLVLLNRMRKVDLLYNNRYNFLQEPWGIGWDYTDNFGEKVTEGDYYYVIEGRIDAPNAKTQHYEYRFVLDNTEPELVVDRQAESMTLSVKDNLSGIFAIEVFTEADEFVDWQEVNKQENPQLLDGEFLVDLSQAKDQNLYIWVYDNARNIKQYYVTADGKLEEVLPGGTEPSEGLEPEIPQESKLEIGEEPNNKEDYLTDEGIDTQDMPAIITSSPWYYQPFGNNEEFVNLAGEISNISQVDYLEYRIIDEAGNVISDYRPLAFEMIEKGLAIFEADISMDYLPENQAYSIETVAYVKSPGGKLMKQQVASRIRVDRQAPEITVDQVFGPDDNYLYFDIEYSDNMNYVELWSGNGMIGRIDKTYDGLGKQIPVAGKIRYSVPKSKIGKELIFTVYDDFGNETETTSVPITLLDLTNIPFDVKTIFNPELDFDEVRYLIDGQEGKANIGLDNQLLVLKEAVDKVIEYGPKRLPYETERIKSEHLEAGLEIVIQQGQDGVLNPLTGEVVRAAINEVLMVGKKAVGQPASEQDASTTERPQEDLGFYINRLEDRLAKPDKYRPKADLDLEKVKAFIEKLKKELKEPQTDSQLENWKEMLKNYTDALVPIHGSQPEKGRKLSSEETVSSSKKAQLPKTGGSGLSSIIQTPIWSFISLLGLSKTQRKKELTK